MLSPPPKNPSTPRDLTSDSYSLPLCVPGSSAKVRSLVAYFNQKSHEKGAPITSAQNHRHDWNEIPRDKVKSLVLNFSRLGIAPPGSNNQISFAGPVTADGGCSRPGKVAVMDNDCALSGSKGEGEGGDPVRSASLPVGDAPPYAVSSSGSGRGVDGSTSEDFGVSNNRKLGEFRAVESWKGGKNSKLGEGGRGGGGGRGKPSSINGQATVARKSMRRKKCSARFPENEATKDISIRGRPLRRPEEPDDRLPRSLQGLAQRESLRSSSLEVDPTDTNSPASLSVLESEAAAAESEADTEIKSPKTGNAVSDSISSKRSFLGFIGGTFRSIRDSFKEKTPPQQMPSATATMTGVISEQVNRASEPEGYVSGSTVGVPVSSSVLGDGAADTDAECLTARESFSQPRGSSSTGSAALRMRSEIKELGRLETLRPGTKDGNSSREGFTGTVLDKVLGAEKALDSASSRENIRESDGRGSPHRLPGNGPIVDLVARSRRHSASYRSGPCGAKIGPRPVAGISPRRLPRDLPFRSPTLAVSPARPLRVFETRGESPVAMASAGGDLVELATRTEKREVLKVAARGDDGDGVSWDVQSSKARGRGVAGACTEWSRSLTPPDAAEVNPAFGTVLSTPRNTTESPESMTLQDSPQVSAGSPSLMRENAPPSLAPRGKVPPGEPTGRSSSEKRKSNASKELVREVPKRKIVQDDRWITYQKVLSQGSVANRGVKIQDEPGNRGYGGWISPSKPGVLQLETKANSTVTNPYNVLAPPQLPPDPGVGEEARMISIKTTS